MADQLTSRIEHEDLLRAVLETVPVGVIFADTGGNLTYASPEAVRILGGQPESITGRGGSGAPQLLKPDGTPFPVDEMPLVRTRREGEAVCGVRMIVRRPGGGELTILADTRPVLDGDGEVIGAVGSLTDITELVRAEDELRASEERFRSAFTSNVVALAIWDTHGNLLDANDQFLKIIGYTRDEFEKGKVRWDEATPPEMRQRDYDATAELVAGRDIEPYEKEFVRPDGTRVPVIIGGRILPGASREVGIAFAIDITDRKRAEEALRESEERYRTLFEASPDAIVISDPHGHVLSANPTAQAMFGYTEEELRQVGRDGVVAPEDHRIDALLEERSRTRRTCGAVTYMRKDGSRFDGEMNSVLLPDSNRALVFIRDLTSRALAEQALRESEQRYRLLYETMLQGVVYQDADGKIITMNPAAVRILGKTPEEFLGETSVSVERDTIRPDGTPFPGTEHPAMVALQTGREMQNVVMGVYNPREHRYRWIEISAVPLFRDGETTPYQAYTIFSDITARKQAQEDLASTLDETRRDRRFIAAIEAISEAALLAASLEEVLKAIAARIRDGMGTHSSTLFLLDEDRQELVAVAACNIPEDIGFRISANECFIGRVLRERRTVYIPDVQQDPEVTNPHIKRTGAASALGTPLIGRRGIVGVVYVDECVIHEFSHDDRRLIETLAARTALVIENAQLVDELARNFTMLQRALLPPEPEQIPGYGVASVYRPGARGAEIGGDFYDVFHTENGCVGIVIGDVVGKGIPSASLAAATRSTLRAFIYDSSSPKESLMHTNAVIGPEKEDASLFVTAHAAVLDPETGRICYAGAGHPPPAIYHRETGRVEFLREGNPPVGVVRDYEFAEWETRLAEGDKIVFYTDGLDEARRGPLLFGTEGIERILRETGDRSPDDVLSALLSAALDWAEGNLQDDAAIIVIERILS